MKPVVLEVHVPEGYRWLVRDALGAAYAYRERPKIVTWKAANGREFQGWETTRSRLLLTGPEVSRHTPRWKESLTEI